MIDDLLDLARRWKEELRALGFDVPDVVDDSRDLQEEARQLFAELNATLDEPVVIDYSRDPLDEVRRLSAEAQAALEDLGPL